MFMFSKWLPNLSLVITSAFKADEMKRYHQSGLPFCVYHPRIIPRRHKLLSLWLELCYVATPSRKPVWETTQAKCPPTLFIWRQQGKRTANVYLTSLPAAATGLLRCVGAAENLLQIKYCLEAYLEKLRKVECFGWGEDRSLELYVVSTLSPSRYFLFSSCLAPRSSCN